MAADATGTWTGTLAPENGGEGPALLVLKQDGPSLTGSAGPGEQQQHAILNGRAENGKITFEISVGEANAKFVLTQEGEEMKGDVKLERDGQAQNAKLTPKRSK